MTLGNGGLAVIGRVAWHGMDKPGSMIIASHELTPDGLWLDDDGLLSWDLTTTDGAWASPHFRWSEFRCACPRDCPGKRAVPRLGLLRALETARWLLMDPSSDFPLHVSGPARCEEHNLEIGGALNSAHLVQWISQGAPAVDEWGYRVPEECWNAPGPGSALPAQPPIKGLWMFEGLDVRPLEPMLTHGTLSRVYGALETVGVAGLGLYWDPPAESAAGRTRGGKLIAPRTLARGHVHADVKGRGGRRARWIRLPGMQKPYDAKG